MSNEITIKDLGKAFPGPSYPIFPPTKFQKFDSGENKYNLQPKL